MTDNVTSINKHRTDTVEDQEDFVLDSPISIMAKLRQLAKGKVTITAYFKGGNQSMNTLVLEVLKDLDLVALDYGPTPELNEQLLQSDRVVFKAELDGITAQFNADSITKAKLHGDTVFAIPIPSQMLWVQRREYFRVRIPLGMPAYCEIRQADGSNRKYKIIDMSAGGVCLHDEHNDIQQLVGDTIHNCKLELPEFGNGKVMLEVRGIYNMNNNDRSKGRRVGCQFHSLGMSFAATIQRYINHVDAMRRRADPDED